MDRTKIGNILNSTEDIICHQVNVYGVMGGGVARQLADRYPKLEEEYSHYCEINNKNYNDLKGKVFYFITDNEKVVANIFSQEPNFNTDYEALKIALLDIKREAKSHKLSVCMPYGIGCGIANGNWNEVYKIIDEVFKDYNVTLYKLEE